MKEIDLLLLFPLLGTIIAALLTYIPETKKKTISNISWIIALISTIGAGITSTTIFIQFKEPKIIASALGTWIKISAFELKMTYYLDTWAVILAFACSWLTALIVLFSKYYIGITKHSSRYYSLVTLFLFGMLLLVVSNSLLIAFLGWEITGICSWGLISYYYYKPGEEGIKASKSGQKALITTGTADIGFLVAIFVLSKQFSTLSITNITTIPTLAAFGLILAAAGKSAQFPLHIWISSTDSRDIDAMQGPTTVSALIHAATMVNAGVYILGRVMILNPTHTIRLTTIYLGTITAIYAGISALGTNDIKRVLAYSTISQLGYMIAILGNEKLGEFASLWHLINHAMFKALLFLSAAVLIHTTHKRKFEEIAGIIRQSKTLTITFFIGFLSLMGIPPFSGFFSKELIIEELWTGDTNEMIAAILLMIGALLTAAYSTRALKLLWGKKPEENTPKTDWSANTTLIILAVATLASFAIYWPMKNMFEKQGILVPEKIVEISSSSIITLGLIIIGIILGFYSHAISRITPKPILKLVEEGFYVDKILSDTSEAIIDFFAKLSVKLQTGSLYWNMIQFLLASSAIGAVIYYAQIGGL